MPGNCNSATVHAGSVVTTWFACRRPISNTHRVASCSARDPKWKAPATRDISPSPCAITACRCCVLTSTKTTERFLDASASTIVRMRWQGWEAGAEKYATTSLPPAASRAPAHSTIVETTRSAIATGRHATTAHARCSRRTPSKLCSNSVSHARSCASGCRPCAWRPRRGGTRGGGRCSRRRRIL